MLLCATSCTKSYEQKPTCFKYLELSDKFNSEIVYDHTDTLWPSGIKGLPAYVCGDDIAKLESFVGDTTGCTTGGYQSFRYVIITN